MLTTKNGGALVQSERTAPKGKNMKVRILKNTMAAKKPVRINQVVDLEEQEAKFLVNIGKAEFLQPPVKKEAPLTPGQARAKKAKEANAANLKAAQEASEKATETKAKAATGTQNTAPAVNKNDAAATATAVK